MLSYKTQVTERYHTANLKKVVGSCEHQICTCLQVHRGPCGKSLIPEVMKNYPPADIPHQEKRGILFPKRLVSDPITSWWGEVGEGVRFRCHLSGSWHPLGLACAGRRHTSYRYFLLCRRFPVAEEDNHHPAPTFRPTALIPPSQPKEGFLRNSDPFRGKFRSASMLVSSTRAFKREA